MQTATALLALALAGLLSLNMNRQRVSTDGSMAAHEVTALALAAAAAELDAAAAFPFDASGDPAHLTPSTAFGTPGGTFADAADLDDLHGAHRNAEVATPNGALPFVIVADVRYVEHAGADGYRPSDVPTLLKELSVTATGPGGTVTLSRLYPFRPTA